MASSPMGPAGREVRTISPTSSASWESVAHWCFRPERTDGSGTLALSGVSVGDATQVVLAGVSADLGAIQRHLAQAHQPSFLADLEDLDQQFSQGAQMVAAKLTDAAVVRLLVAGEHPEGGVFPAGLLDLAGAGQPDAVGVQEQHYHHPRVVGLLAPGILLPVSGVNGLKIQLCGQIQQEEHQLVLRQPLHRRRREEQGLLRVPGAERLGLDHAQVSPPEPLQSLRSGRIQGRLWREYAGSTRDRLLADALPPATSGLQQIGCAWPAEFQARPPGPGPLGSCPGLSPDRSAQVQQVVVHAAAALGLAQLVQRPRLDLPHPLP